MIEDFKKVPNDKIEEYRQQIFNETERASIDLKLITERANEMLEKTNNPFVYTNTQPISIQKVYTILKRNVTSFFPNKEILVKITTYQGKKFVQINEEGFELFLTDWINNMSKYKKSLTDFIFELMGDKIVITFINDHNQSNEVIRNIVKDLQSDIRKEIMMRTTHGLYLIKSALEDMGIEYTAESIEINNTIKFIIYISLIENEDSSI